MELLFTVDEETGLTGANALEHDFVEGRILINIDSEDEGVFTIGCAGGEQTEIDLPIAWTNIIEDLELYRLKVGNLKGGHSGVNIAEQRANAIQLLTRSINTICPICTCQIVDIKGGSAHNAIPRDARQYLQ